jgi:hypothetical protein
VFNHHGHVNRGYADFCNFFQRRGALARNAPAGGVTTGGRQRRGAPCYCDFLLAPPVSTHASRVASCRRRGGLPHLPPTPWVAWGGAAGGAGLTFFFAAGGKISGEAGQLVGVGGGGWGGGGGAASSASS